ncbi:reverse transcriptase-like protein [Psychrobacillus lasiicapitis]|uniref:Reverse transcriptase-like protein n=1 Tax=Psychrobacillus lasiicapitis TaxID=1636719 RepID=A0A544TH95_9BACI|nr:reverse transcriptase-like protein [Psychrobacillus lasiicapitis]TQR16835.1 reverse transcriptase-like protein [Psychrobacillus lasiicapitis]GGA26750.1 ribonuclease H [Psychrobacillus lasiicapitis]
MLEVYIDGSTTGNPGPSGIGIFIKGEGHHLKFSEFIGQYSNHTTEFIALLRGLEEAQKLSPMIVSVRTDSQIVLAAVEKRYTKNAEFAAILEKILAISDTFDLFFIKWIPDDQNKAAHALARQAVLKQLPKS